MPVLKRKTLIDRPVLVDREDEEDEQNNDAEEDVEIRTLGDGGGPVLKNLEFEPGQYDVVAAANTAATLASGEEEGNFFDQSFINAALQLHELDELGRSISRLVEFGEEKGVATIGLTQSQVDTLREDQQSSDATSEEVIEAVSDVDADTEGGAEDGPDGDDVEIEDIEEELEEREDGE